MKVIIAGNRLTRQKEYGGLNAFWIALVDAIINGRQESPEPLSPFSIVTSGAPAKPALSPLLCIEAGNYHDHVQCFPLIDDCEPGVKSEQPSLTCGKVIHLPEPLVSGEILRMANSQSGMPAELSAGLVVTCSDVMYREHPEFIDPWWADRLHRSTEALVKAGVSWICPSCFSRDALQRCYDVADEDIEVIPHGINRKFIKPEESTQKMAQRRQRFELENTPYFIFCGSVETKKNIPCLLAAFRQALDSGLDARLVIAGRMGWGSQQALSLLEEPGAWRNNVIVANFISEPDLVALVNGANALVQPSWYEGFGLTTLEAMAAGIPVLASNTTANAEIAGPAAKLFNPDNPSELAGLMCEIVGDTTLAVTLRDAGLSYCQSFSWESAARSTLSVYRRLAARISS